jgi:putative addiction module component (TIGR02574 family)
MSMALVKEEAMRLAPEERAALAEFLWESLEAEASSAKQRLWALEAEDRIDAVERGDLPVMDGPAAMKKVRLALHR